MSFHSWCFLALFLCAAGAAENRTARSYVSPCSSSDTATTCLFKGLLRTAVIYMSRRADVKFAGGANGAVDPAANTLQQSKGIEDYLIEQIQNILGIFSFGFDIPEVVPWSLLKSSFLNGRGKKNKNLGPMLAAGLAVMAGTLVPLAFGALAMLAGKAIMTSLLALTISGMLGLKSLFSKHEGGHLKSYSALPPAHYSEAQFEQDLGVYKGQTEAKMHSAAGGYYTGESSGRLSGYYKDEQLENEASQPDYYSVNANASQKFNGYENNKKLIEKNEK